jgi:hypothetical protein
MSIDITSVALRNAVQARIQDWFDNGQFGAYPLVNDLEIVATWLPYENLEEHLVKYPDGVLYLIAEPFDDAPRITRNTGAMRSTPIKFVYQRTNIDRSDVAALDQLVQFIGRLYDCVRSLDPQPFSWQRTEAMRDESGAPYSYTMLRETATFESYSTAHYQVVLPPNREEE